jgi:4-hydroxy 2-oxovalerate aldolase
MHAVAHQFTPEQVGRLANGASDAGVSIFEVSHGDGLGGSSITYGFGAATDREWLHAAKSGIKGNTKLSILMCPGIGSLKDLEMAAEEGVTFARIAAHCTEANVTKQHIKMTKSFGMETFGVLMMTHMLEPDQLLEQAKLMEEYGADGVYMMDSSGYLLPDDVRKRVSAMCEHLSIPVGFHAHSNLDMHIANTLAALEEGASQVDGTLRGLGAGAGNAPTEVLVAVLTKYGYDTGIDLYKIMDVAEDILGPMFDYTPIVDRAALIIGYAGVYGSFARHAKDAAIRYGVDARDILIECGKRKAVGGQEDMIIAVAVELANKKRSG